MNDHAHDHHHDHGFDSPEGAARAALDGEVMAPAAAEAIAAAASLAAELGTDVVRVLDLGCGPGVGSVQLAEGFARAEIIAVDDSEAMLHAVTERAADAGLADRIRTRRATFPDGLAHLEPADVVWASMAMHHVGDQAAALRQISHLVRPGGLVALVESGGPTRVLPDGDDLDRPGLWERIDHARSEWFAGMRSELPGAVADDDYLEMLAAAGLSPRGVLTLDVEYPAPLEWTVRSYAREWLLRMAVQLEPHADPDDVACLARLADEAAPDGILQRPDARFTASRILYLGSR